MSKKVLCLLVGMHFRPPAKALTQQLPTGAKVRLEPEPENQYDADAVRVLFNGTDLPEKISEEAEAVYLSQGFSSEEIRMAEEEWQLGYIAKTGGKPLAGKPWMGNRQLKEILQQDGEWREHQASLTFGPAGEPLVLVELLDDQG